MTSETQCHECGRNTLKYYAKHREYRCTHEDCGEVIPMADLATAPSIDLDPVPSFVALPVSQWLEEKNPVLRLWRISDAVEILLRYAFSIALADLLRRCGGALPSDVAKHFRDSINKPTYRVWVELTRQVFTAHDEIASVAAPLLVTGKASDGIRAAVFPLIGNNDDETDTHLLPLRNLLAHGGGMTRRAAQRFLDEHGHEARALDALRAQLGWLGAHVVTYVRGPGDYLELRGPQTSHAPPVGFPPTLCDNLDAYPGRVLLVGAESCTLDLSPLCGFGIPEMPRKGKPVRRGETFVAEIYVRCQTATVLYNALGAEIPLSERGGDAFERLSSLFSHDLAPAAPVPGGGSAPSATDGDFEAELQADADAMRGRAAELCAVLKVVLATRQGTLWLAGQAGIGKSTLMAAVARNPRLLSQRHILVVAHRFKAGDARCSRRAFLQRAVGKLEAWREVPESDAGSKAVEPTGSLPELDDSALEARMDRLLHRIADALPKRQAPRVVFLLDGLDEIARIDPGVLDLPRRQGHLSTLWLCAGRPEPRLNAAFARRGDVQELFPASADNPDGGLPRLSPNGVREILLEGSSALRYEILSIDRERGDAVQNDLIEAVYQRADGLPIYVKLAIDDLVRGHLRVSTAIEDLPLSLENYYEELLRRYGIDDLHQILTPLVAMLAIAREPLDEATLHALMVFRTLAEPGDLGRELVRRAIEAASPVLRRALTSEGMIGYVPYHTSFRSHVSEVSEHTRQAVITARTALAEAAANGWRDPRVKAAWPFLFRSGIRYLFDDGQTHKAAALLIDMNYLIARIDLLAPEAIFGLRADMIATPPEQRPEEFAVWQRLLDRYGHLIARGGAQTLLERAVAEASNSAVTRVAEAWLARGGWSKPWFRRANLPQTVSREACLRTLQGHTDGVRAVAVHPDGKRVLSGGEDWILKIWDLDTGACLRSLEGHTARINAVAVSRDGCRVLSASEDRTLKLWDVETGACLGTFAGHVSAVISAALADGRRALSSGDDGTLRLWDLDTGANLCVQREGSSCVRSIVVHPNGRRALVACDNASLEEWDLDTRSLLRIVAQGDGEWAEVIHSMAVHGDGRFVTSGGEGGQLILWDLTTEKCAIWSSDGHFRFSTATSVAMAASETKVILLSADDYGTVAVLSLRGDAKSYSLRDHPRGFTAVAIDHAGRRGVSGGSDGTIKVWDLEVGLDANHTSAHGETIVSVAMHPEGRFALSASRDRTLYWWDIETCTKVGSTMGPTFSFYCAIFDPRDPHGRRAVAGEYESIAVRTVDAYEVGQGVDGHAGSVGCVAAHAGTGRAISGDSQGGLKVWDLATSACVWDLHGHTSIVCSVAIDNNGRRAVSSDGDGHLAVWDLSNGECLRLWRAHESSVSTVVVDPWGKFTLSAGWDGTIAVWDISTGDCVRRIQAHAGGVAALALQPDGRRVASGGADHALKLWDREQWKVLGTFQTEATITSIVIAPSGRLIYGDNIGRVEFLDWVKGRTAPPY